jgi:hypothetical protein
VKAIRQGGVGAIYPDESVWLTSQMMRTLDNVQHQITNCHPKKVFSDKEVSAYIVIRKFRITAANNKTYVLDDERIKSGGSI